MREDEERGGVSQRADNHREPEHHGDDRALVAEARYDAHNRRPRSVEGDAAVLDAKLEERLVQGGEHERQRQRSVHHDVVLTYDRDTLERMGQSEDAEEAVRDEEVQAPTRVR